MSGANDCPRCGADMVLPERVCIICLTAENARLRADNLQLVNDLEAEGARVGMLQAENARLRGEVEVAYASRNEAVERANQLEFHDVPERDAEIRDAMHDLRASEYVSETRRTELLKCIADLARVTAERDALLAAGRDVLTSETITPPRSSDAIVLKKWAALIAACMLPGKEGG